MPGLDTTELLDLLREVAAAVIQPRFRALTDEQVTEKSPGDLVTVADREAEALITRRLREAYPDALVLGEEAVAEDRNLLDRYATAAHAFTVDPLDGTRNFVHGRTAFAVMVAELRGPEVVRSWIWQPELHTGYAAERGSGAWRDGVRMPALPDWDGGRDLVGRVSRPELAGRTAAGLAPLADTWWSCGVDYPRLASGETDFLWYRGGGAPWDHAPGSLLLREVGGYVGHADGTVYDPRHAAPGVVAARARAAYDAVCAGVPTLVSG
ncbi:MAG: inositol monophosphatase [Lapillicoccus sp.]